MILHFLIHFVFINKMRDLFLHDLFSKRAKEVHLLQFLFMIDEKSEWRSGINRSTDRFFVNSLIIDR